MQKKEHRHFYPFLDIFCEEENLEKNGWKICQIAGVILVDLNPEHLLTLLVLKPLLNALNYKNHLIWHGQITFPMGRLPAIKVKYYCDIVSRGFL